MKSNNQNTSLADFIWKNADDLWGNFKHVDFGKNIMPFTLLRRLECVLEPTRDQANEMFKTASDQGLDAQRRAGLRPNGQSLHCGYSLPWSHWFRKVDQIAF